MLFILMKIFFLKIKTVYYIYINYKKMYVILTEGVVN